MLNGGVADPNSISPALMKEMYLVGNRQGHYRAFLSLLRNSASWETASKDYGRIEIPVLLIWGDKDSGTALRARARPQVIPGAQMTTLDRGGHFLALDRPQELNQLIIRFAGK